MNKFHAVVPIIGQIFPKHLVSLVLAPILVGYIIDYELVHPLTIAVNLLWMMVFTIPYSVFQKTYLYYIAVIFYFIIGFCEITHWILMKGPLTITSLLVIFSTNFEETKAFLTLKSTGVLFILVPYIFLFKHALQYPHKKIKSKNKLIVNGLFALVPFICFLWAYGNIPKARVIPQVAKVMLAFVNEIAIYNKAIAENKLQKVEAKLVTDNDQQTFVMIVGESCSRNHMSLYGAPLKTNPLLQSRDDLLLYTDVVSPHSYTTLSIPSILSESNLENKIGFAKSIDILDIFHSAGFKTYWISNQSQIGLWDNIVSSIAKKADYTKFINTSSNTSLEAIITKSDDFGLFAPFSEVLEDKTDKKFIVLHLMGSHSTYSKRYPASFDHFKGEGFKETIIAEYRNSILYNDYVVDSLLNLLKEDAIDKNLVTSAIYSSDHGENLYDEQNRLGHDYSNIMPRANVEVPFVVWLSPKYIEENQNKSSTIKINMNRPFVSDDLFHCIMDINNISSPYFEEERSVFNPKFNYKRKRILVDGKDYDRP